MSTPQATGQRSRWIDLCLAAAAGSALATGAALYWRHRSSLGSGRWCARAGASCGSPPQIDAAVQPECDAATVPPPAPQSHQRQWHQQQPDEQTQEQQPPDAQERCRHDSAQSVDTSALLIWQRVSKLKEADVTSDCIRRPVKPESMCCLLSLPQTPGPWYPQGCKGS